MLFVVVLSLFFLTAFLSKAEQGCAIPDLPNVIVTGSNGTHTDNLKHGENVSVSCEGESFLYDNSKKEFIKERSFAMKCESGKISSKPSCKQALSCELPDDQYASYFVNGKKHNEETILHEGEVRVVCENGTSLTVSSDVKKCWNGVWRSGMHLPVCVPGCAIPDIPNANITRTNGSHTDKLNHGENITVTCHEGYSIQNSEVDDYYSYRDYFDVENNDAHFTLTCNNGTIENKQCELSQESIDQPENMDPTIKPISPDNETTTVPNDETTSPIDNDHGVLNCTIPESTDVHFMTLSGGELKEGTQIPNGKKFRAEKECKDYYEGYYLNSDDVDGEEISPPIRPIDKIVNCTDGVLSDYTLVCDDASRCELPNDPYASYYVNGEIYRGNNTVSHEEKVRVVCENGTRLTVSSDVRTCWDGAWKSGEFPVCKTECGRPPDVQGALPEPEFRDITSFPSGATIQYRCDIKHYLVELTSWSRTCSDGKWDEIQFRCIVKSCPALNTPDNGKRMDFNYKVGTFAKFTCNTGYEMVGVAQLLCKTDMKWSPKDPPTCKPVLCPDDSYLANGWVVQETYRQEKNTFGLTNRYFCNSGYVIKGSSARTCQASKSWSDTKPICDMPRCPDMRVENGEIKYIGDKARYTYAHVNCNDGYTVGKDGVETVECLGSLQWESILHCYKEGCEAPIDNGNDAFYRNGTTYTVTHESCSGGNIPSFKGLITCVNGRWSEQVSCLRGASYRITVKTADIKWSVGEGTDGEVYLHMYGSNGNSGKIILHGEFEAGDEDLTVGLCFDVGEISKIKLGVNALSFSYDGWKPESVQIEDVSRGVYYAFKHDLTEVDDTSIILYPVGGKANILG